MKKIVVSLILLILSNCSLDKVVQHHGIHNLENKQLKLKINKTNKNDIIKIIGPPSSKSSFDNDIYIYIEKKTSSSKLTKLGKKKLILNNVLVLEINDKGLLESKKFYTQKEMNNIKFDETITSTDYSKRSFIYNFLSSLRQKIDDPLGKKRAKIN
jgi:outer membrane protein assembly factor BamE (lipoprotein component of BamABCDE complex)|tara:strand:+ start:130 stop:597 length:468 start_codon:yes stop_codon:yes gene_type:complete